jgi:hypothetical protein
MKERNNTLSHADSSIEMATPLNHTRGLPPGDPTEVELRQEMVAVLREARKGLTEDSIYAVLSLRHTISVYQALVDLLLEEKIRAEVIDKASDLSCNNFNTCSGRIPTRPPGQVVERFVVIDGKAYTTPWGLGESLALFPDGSRVRIEHLGPNGRFKQFKVTFL